ncbi:MAG: MerR family transcriptional regulator, light-induced transcriptional regulator [Acidobacteriota bacterium]|jgi:DNA-binding transcriptional MerR regulator/methylmalonyl-CoA mutase cobalamin-binding subunit|nr:MerR family transcriptional regulator, light-induced transcriptional regulator [Acidobacteriota bacterium]
MPTSRSSSSSHRHPIGVVARRTGLKPDLIRAWERRYGAVEPGRTDTRRRFYSDEDIERLLLLRRVVSTGRGISQVARLSTEELEALLESEALAAPTQQQASASPASFAESGGNGDLAEEYLSRCLAAAHRLDVRELEMLIERASVAFSRTNLIEKVLVPFMQRIGDLWHQGTLRPLHEHMASAVVRSFLGAMYGSHQPELSAPQLVVTTPSRQHHELGALVAAASAAGEGWQVTYLGPELPPEEIAAAALQKGARAVALSLTYPPDDPMLVDDLRRLRRLLGSRTTLIVGGRVAPSYAGVLAEIGALQVEGLPELRQHLQNLRSVVPEAAP